MSELGLGLGSKSDHNIGVVTWRSNCGVWGGVVWCGVVWWCGVVV